MGRPHSLSFPPGAWRGDRGCVGEQWLTVPSSELGLSSAPRNEGLGVASSRNPRPSPPPDAPQSQIVPHPNQCPRVRKEGRGQINSVGYEAAEVVDDPPPIGPQSPPTALPPRPYTGRGRMNGGQRSRDVAKDPWPFWPSAFPSSRGRPCSHFH